MFSLIDKTMSLVLENTETDTRTRILLAAERLFREIGYQKTTVADIAKVSENLKVSGEKVAGAMGELSDNAELVATHTRESQHETQEAVKDTARSAEAGEGAVRGIGQPVEQPAGLRSHRRRSGGDQRLQLRAIG